MASSPSSSLSPSPGLLLHHNPPPPKKSPAFPWTHQETLALIQAYQEKWYSLKKGQLKAFQWEEVSITVAARCGFDEPTKTSTQCRHKIEKLRKRYRSELRKPYPNSWQYFLYMDQMERGPMPLNAVKSSSPNVSVTTNGNYYASLYSSSTDYYFNGNGSTSNNHGGVNVSDESDEEEWNGVEAMAKSSSKSRAMGKGGSVRISRDAVNGKQRQHFDVGNDDDDDNDDDDSIDDLEEEERMLEAGDGGDSGKTELAAEIKGFGETFIRMENGKIEMMREMERYRMETEKKRMDMILDAQRKIIDTIDRTFGSCEKAKMDDQET